MGKATERPNILFLFADHQAFYGHDRPGEFEYKWPRFERFAAEGARFARAYCVAPLCTPARASAMTGVYPSAHKLIFNTDNYTPHDFAGGTRLYSHYLAAAGYRNAYVGKWHCGKDRLPVDYGIEGWSLPDYGQPYLSDAYARYAAERGLGPATAHIERVLRRPQWNDTDQVLRHESPWHFMNGFGVLHGPPDAHEEQFVAHLCIEKLRELAAAGRPWSLVASFWGPHQPFYPTEPFASRVDPAGIPEYPTFREDLSGKPLRYWLHKQFIHGSGEWADWPAWQRCLARAYGQGYQTDAAIGSILDALDALGLAESTLVIWATDHGDMLASHGGLFDKQGEFAEEIARVPMAIRWPGALAAGRVLEHRVSNMDVTATMLEAAGVATPPHMHSRSLLDLARGEDAGWPDAVFCEQFGHGAIKLYQHMIVAERYKYVACMYDDDEMYDLVADPYERTNLIHAPEVADVRTDLRRRIAEHCRELGHRDALWLAAALDAGR